MLIRPALLTFFVTVDFFLIKGFEFQPYVCCLCLDFLMMSMNLSKIYILDIKSADCLCIIGGISKGEAINLI